MDDRWNRTEAADFVGPVQECVYATRLIGSDPSLVMHGGGNSSVKAPFADITGREIEAIYVKGSGWEMRTIEAAGLTPLRLERTRDLLELDRLNDIDMMRELDAARLDSSSPSPSVETLLHAFLPHRAVQHSHADVIVSLTNLASGGDTVGEVFDDSVVVVPYVMPGFDLARAVRNKFEESAHPGTVGMVLLKHGLFTFGQTSEQAYRRHVDLISQAENYLDRNVQPRQAVSEPLPAANPLEIAELRRDVSETAGAPMVLCRHTDDESRQFVRRTDLDSLTRQGPLTPDHVIRIKPFPMVGRDVDGYATEYNEYVATHRWRARTELVDIDPAPRIILDSTLGMLAAGPTIGDADIASDIYRHTMPVVARSEDHLGGYEGLAEADLFDMEYWALEQAKLSRRGSPQTFAGMVALVTGAASGIGRACAEALLEEGACVTGIDLSPEIEAVRHGDGWFGMQVDVTDESAQRDALQATVERFGGVDIAIVSAGVFGAAQPIGELSLAEWSSVMSVNLHAAAALLSALHPILVLSPVGGRVAVIGSKNVPAPGRGAGAYSASKAALTQLSRVAALEWAGDRIRINVVHPDAVFDTGLWTDDLLAERAARYGLTVDDYKRRNLLGAEITSADVAAAVLAVCGDSFRVTTGAQIPVDGGNERVV